MFRSFYYLFISFPLLAISFSEVTQLFPDDALWEGRSDAEEVMFCLHGFGMNRSIGSLIHGIDVIPHHLVCFNFPDHGGTIDKKHPEKLSFGTIQELKPVIDRLHTYVNGWGASSVHLYGFSAGGGAAVNVLAVLRAHRFENELGLTAEEMDRIFAAIERGTVILDCPLKSVDEIVDERESVDESVIYGAAVYKRNDLRPIDSLLKLGGARLNVVLIFAQPDIILSNRDDALYVERLEKANHAGKTIVVWGTEGRHLPMMPSLIKGYERLLMLTYIYPNS